MICSQDEHRNCAFSHRNWNRSAEQYVPERVVQIVPGAQVLVRVIRQTIEEIEDRELSAADKLIDEFIKENEQKKAKTKAVQNDVVSTNEELTEKELENVTAGQNIDYEDVIKL